MSREYPRITIVTPSYNTARFLESSIRSVVDQGYPNLEYAIVDGGSTDGSLDIIRKYEKSMAWWISEPDKGLYDALNKGFSRTTGEIMGWINADDMHTPWALKLVSEVFTALPRVEWLTTLAPLCWDEEGKAVARPDSIGYCRKGFLRGENLPGSRCHGTTLIQQESTFWRRSLWERVGGRLDTSWRLAADFELWARFFQYTELYCLRPPIGGFRMHYDQLTARFSEEYRREAQEILARYGGRPYGRFESYLRLRAFPALPAHRLQRKLRLLYPRLVCQHCGRRGGWEVKVI